MAKVYSDTYLSLDGVMSSPEKWLDPYFGDEMRDDLARRLESCAAMVLGTGRYRFRFFSTAQLPHGWDAGLLFEETQRTLFCSDLFHQDGDVEPLTEADLTDRVRAALGRMQAGPLANYVPYTPRTDGVLAGLAELRPRTLAVMHGSSFAGDGEGALRGLAVTLREALGR